MDARGSWEKMRKSLAEKRKRISSEQIAEIVRLYGTFAESERVKTLCLMKALMVLRRSPKLRVFLPAVDSSMVVDSPIGRIHLNFKLT